MVPSDTLHHPTPWAVRLYRFTSAAAMRMMVPSSEMSQDVVVLLHHLDPGGLASLFGDLVSLQAEASPVLGFSPGTDVLLNVGALAIAVFRNGQQGSTQLGQHPRR